MRPFVSFFTFFSFFSAAALVTARTETISSLDKRISYDNPLWRKVSLRVTWVARSILIFDLSQIDAPGGGFMYLRRGRGSATLTVFSEHWCISPMEVMLTK